ncbi:unnamed protein product [Protopolystoma xenopodis]|uniref:ECT2 PH domain-containing protein n=1 Tax=Protopolystoma xenopodis TaxID=117903 RepID=A0A448WG98_9PLAT|nr:unnamed protein product [Protopolystoma xenopodis]
MPWISNFTPKCHPDYEDIKLFARKLNDLLNSVNDRLRKNEERLSLLSLYHEISGAPPEMLSSSRSYIARLNVFELGSSASGSVTCEPVTLFLLSDSLEVAKPRKRHTGEPLAHAIRAALAAVQGSESSVPSHDLAASNCDSGTCTDLSSGPVASGGSFHQGASLSAVSRVSRAGSGASTNTISSGLSSAAVSLGGGSSGVVDSGCSSSGVGSAMSLGEGGKQRVQHHYKHLHLLKLHEIKRVRPFSSLFC